MSESLLFLIIFELKCICNNNFKLSQNLNIFRAIEDQFTSFKIICSNHAAFNVEKWLNI